MLRNNPELNITEISDRIGCLLYTSNVEIGDDCIIMSGAKILHGTRMGKGHKVHHNAVLGAEPQDCHYTGESSMPVSYTHRGSYGNTPQQPAEKRLHFSMAFTF